MKTLPLLLWLAILPGLATPPAQPAASQLESALLLPNYLFERDLAGLTTLFAVRNRSDTEITVTLDYFASQTAPTEAPAVREVVTIGPRETLTRNLRDVLNAPTNGYMIATVVEAQTLTPLPDQSVLSGDFFRMDITGNFASGDPLVAYSTPGRAAAADGLCNRWDTRYFTTGAFSGGTEFAFFVEENTTNGNNPILTGDIYDETGQFIVQIQVLADGHAFSFASSVLEQPPLSIDVPFGSIEWQFTENRRGHLSTVLKASDRFSVGFAATCTD